MRGRIHRPLAEFDDFLSEQSAKAMEEFRAQEQERREIRAHRSGVREFMRITAWALLAGIIVFAVATMAAGQDRVPDPRVIVAQGTVEARSSAQPDLDDDLGGGRRSQGETAGVSARPAAEAGVDAPPTAPAAAPPVSFFVHRFQYRPQRMVPGARSYTGTAVSIGQGVWLTCAHNVPVGGLTVWIQGQQRGGRITRATQGRDFAVFRANGGGDEAALEISTEWPRFRAEAVVVGIPGADPDQEPVVHRGIIGGDRRVILDADDPGYQQGESGGGVFIDGVLVGIAHGIVGESPDAPREPRVVHYTPLAQVADLIPGRAPAVQEEAWQGDGRPVVWMDEPEGNWCGVCRAVFAQYQQRQDLGFQIRKRTDHQKQRSSYPHFHAVGPDGQEICLGSHGSLQAVEQAWNNSRR